MSSSIPDPSTRAFAGTVATLQRDVDALKRAQRAAQLGNSSIDNGALTIKDVYGIVRGSVGLQPDGTFAVASMNASVPPNTPTTPILTAIASGLVAKWDGKLLSGPLPGDFKLIEIYVGTTNSFTPGLDNFVGTLTIGGEFPVAPLVSGTTYYVRFIAVNNSETQLGTGIRPTASPPSAVASIIPEQVVAQAVLDGIVNTVALADQAVAQSKIALQAVGTGQIAGNAVDVSKLADNSVNAAKLVDNSVTTPKIVNNAVVAPKINDLAITTPKIALVAVTTPTINNQAVTTPIITPAAVTAPILGPAAVTGPAIAASAVTANSIAANTITAGKIATDSLTANEISADAITASELSANSVIAGKVAANAITSTTIAAGSITANAMTANSIATGSLQADSVTAVALAANSVTASEISANSVTAGKVAADAISANEIQTNAITSLEVSAGAITAGKVAADAITSVEISANAVTTSELNAGSVNASKVVAGTIGATELAANSVVAGKIATNAVTTATIAAGAVNAGTIAAGAVNTTALAADSVTTAKIAALAVVAGSIDVNAINAGHIQAGAVTAAKLAATLVLGTTIIAGVQNGARIVLNSGGIEGYRTNGTTKTLDFDNATGNLLIAGQYRSGDSGERVIINVDGTQQFTNSGGGTSGKIANNGNDLLISGTPGGSSRTGCFNTNSTSAGITYRNPGSTTLYGEVNVQTGIVQNNAAIVFLHADQQVAAPYGTQRVQFSTVDSNGNEYGTSVLNYVAASQKAALLSPSENIGLKFEVGQISVTNGNATAFGPIKATSFVPSSSETLKENIAEIALPGGRTSWDIIEGAPALNWHYISEKPNILERPTDTEGNIVTRRIRNPAFTDAELDAMMDYDPDKWVQTRDVYSPEALASKSTRRLHKFPLAEDLNAVCSDLIDGDETDPEKMGADLRDVVGILWDATDMLIKRNRLLEQVLTQRFPILANALPGRPQKGDLKEGIGAIIQGRTRRTLDISTGQIRDRIKAALNQIN